MKGKISDIRVKLDYNLIQTKSPVELKSLVAKAQRIAYEISELQGWDFQLGMLMVGLSYCETMMANNKEPTLFFSIDWAHSGHEDREDRRKILRSNRKGIYYTYHGWADLVQAWNRGDLADKVKMGAAFSGPSGQPKRRPGREKIPGKFRLLGGAANG